MTPRELVSSWVELFNRANAEALSELYHKDAVNHQLPNSPIVGKDAIRKMFQAEFKQAKMICIIEHVFEDGEWAILEWKDPLGLRGCGFFHVVEGRIRVQRGYWDKLSFLRQHSLPLPRE